MIPNTVVQHATLCCHPASACTAIKDIQITAQRLSVTTLRLSYRVSGQLHAMRVPALSSAVRRDELWRHTCAELFVATSQAESYCEFNFAPSTEWEAYEFTAYRQGMCSADCAAPLIQVTHGEHELRMEVLVNLPVQLESHECLQLGLTMVIEDTAGQCSYWALAHGAARPDFHHRDSFILNV